MVEIMMIYLSLFSKKVIHDSMCTIETATVRSIIRFVKILLLMFKDLIGKKQKPC
jgi:hypothetical protein